VLRRNSFGIEAEVFYACFNQPLVVNAQFGNSNFIPELFYQPERPFCTLSASREGARASSRMSERQMGEK
jgi:hypothetical protein